MASFIKFSSSLFLRKIAALTKGFGYPEIGEFYKILKLIILRKRAALTKVSAILQW